MEKLDNEGRMKVKLCKVEEREPDVNWQVIYHMSRLKGHNPQVKSFNFKLVHQLLPCKERLSQILPSSAPLCSLCTSQQPESIFHAFLECDRNKDAALHLLNLTRVYDSTVSALKITRLQISTEVLYELPAMLLLCSGLEFIWRQRLEKKTTSVYDIRAELECLVCTLRKSRLKKLRDVPSLKILWKKSLLYNFLLM